MLNRKNFLKLSSMSFGSLMIPNLLFSQNPLQIVNVVNDPAQKALADLALNAVRSKGAAYADVRISSVQGGAGIRVFVNEAWGFASTASVTNEGMLLCAAEAMADAARQSPGSTRHQYDLRVAHDVWSCAFFRK